MPRFSGLFRLLFGLALTATVALVVAADVGDVQSLQSLDGKAHLILEPKAHYGDVFGLAFSSDGQTLYTGSRDRTARSWDIGTGQLMHVFRGQIGSRSGGGNMYHGEVYAIASHPNEHLLAVAGNQPHVIRGSPGRPNEDVSIIRLVNTLSGEVEHWLKGHQNAIVYVLEYSGQGHLLASGAHDGSLYVWQVSKDGAPPFELKGGHKPGSAIVSLSFSPDGSRLVSGGSDGSLVCWELQSKKVLWKALQTSSKDASYWMPVAWSPDGKWIASGSSERKLHLWAADTGQSSFDFVLPSLVASVSFNYDSTLLAVSVYDGDGYTSILQCRVDGGRLEVLGQALRPQRFGEVRKVLFSPTSNYLAVASSGGQVFVLDAGVAFTSGADIAKHLIELRGPGSAVMRVAWSIDSAFVGFSRSKAISEPFEFCYSVRSPLVLLRAERDPFVRIPGVGFGDSSFWKNRSGRTMRHSGGVKYELVLDGVKVATIQLPDANDLSVTWDISPDRSLVAVAAELGAYLYSARNGKLLMKMRGHFGRVTDIAFSPDGKWIATSSVDQTVCLWSTKVAQEISDPTLSIFAADNSEWVAWNRNGFHAASPRGAEFVGVQTNRSATEAAKFAFALESFRAEFRRPDVLALLMDARVEGNVSEAKNRADEEFERRRAVQLRPPILVGDERYAREVSKRGTAINAETITNSTKTFVAYIPEAYKPREVKWTKSSGVGTISVSGDKVVFQAGPTPGEAVLVATSVADPSRKAVVTIAVSPEPVPSGDILVAERAQANQKDKRANALVLHLRTKDKVSFQAFVPADFRSRDVSWTKMEGGGTLRSRGDSADFEAPDKAGEVQIVVRSGAYSGKIATIRIEVSAPPPPPAKPEPIKEIEKVQVEDPPPSVKLLRIEPQPEIDPKTKLPVVKTHDVKFVLKVESAHLDTLEIIPRVISVPEEGAKDLRTWRGDPHQGPRSSTVEVPIKVFEGKNKIVFVVRHIGSAGTDVKGEDLVVDLKAETPMVEPEKLPNLYLLTVGVGEYKEPYWNTLKYADRDANRMAEVFEAQKGGPLYDKVFVTKLTNEVATRERILKAFSDIQSQATDNDVVIVHLSGHGRAIESLDPTKGNQREFLFLPYDYNEGIGGAESLSTAISWADVLRRMSSIRGRARVLFADACRSEGAEAKADETKAAALDDTPVSEFSVLPLYSSTRHEESFESQALEMGVFTYLVAEVIAGNGQSIAREPVRGTSPRRPTLWDVKVLVGAAILKHLPDEVLLSGKSQTPYLAAVDAVAKGLVLAQHDRIAKAVVQMDLLLKWGLLLRGPSAARLRFNHVFPRTLFRSPQLRQFS